MAAKPIGRAELEILNYVHERHPITVRQVADEFGPAKGVVRTTVLNVMNRLVQKGFLSRRKEDGVFVNRPRVPKTRLMRDLVRDFVDKSLEGSVSPFMTYLAEDARLSEEDVQRLRDLVKSLDDRARKER
jgi:predicted transcriptional regulator